ncbi:DUF3298 domain-containing protein [Thiocystis violacea]|uniref:DUF3298 domain-containing protein n=1 Tax=Thiocystis violacea TaxID=13725 RepID=UPI001906033A|nr:DUF3298 domain-containing protein [Thiocystis violacea]MBK1723556.1 hypothetical protein [Thiocystis violacea]
MKPHHLTLIAASLLAWSTTPQAASFDCGKARTWIEQTICGDAALSRLDARMAKAFEAARSALTEASEREALLEAQRAWLQRRDACGDTGCLSELYGARLAALSERPASATPDAMDRVSEGHISDAGPGYRISARYPVFKDPALTPINAQIRAFVQSLIAPFLQEHTDEAPGLAELGELPPWSLTLDYQKPYRASRYVAIAFSGDDYRGGAHGMPIMEPLILTLPDGRRIAPQELFAPASDWLSVLSDDAYRALSEDEFIAADDDWLKTGTAPQAENYRLLYPGAEGLTLTFPPYAVAPYAAGPQSVVVPYARLKGLLNPAFFPR